MIILPFFIVIVPSIFMFAWSNTTVLQLEIVRFPRILKLDSNRWMDPSSKSKSSISFVKEKDGKIYSKIGVVMSYPECLKLSYN